LNINFKEYKKEIIVILIYLVIFSALIFAAKSLNAMNEDVVYEEATAKKRYEDIKNIEFSKESLEKELEMIDLDVKELEKKVPDNLDYRTVNEILSEISLNTNGTFNLGNCTIEEAKVLIDNKTSDKYKAYQVKISAIKGEYEQVKKMLEYIKNYENKISITQLNFAKNSTTIEGNMTLKFFYKV